MTGFSSFKPWRFRRENVLKTLLEEKRVIRGNKKAQFG